MDTFDQRRSISLVFGLVALGLALALGHVNDQRAERHDNAAPVEAKLSANTRG